MKLLSRQNDARQHKPQATSGALRLFVGNFLPSLFPYGTKISMHSHGGKRTGGRTRDEAVSRLRVNEMRER